MKNSSGYHRGVSFFPVDRRVHQAIPQFWAAVRRLTGSTQTPGGLDAGPAVPLGRTADSTAAAREPVRAQTQSPGRDEHASSGNSKR
jgi:hypothetical protein